MERNRRIRWWELPPEEQKRLIERQKEIDRARTPQIPWWDDRLPDEASLNKNPARRKSTRRRKEVTNIPSVPEDLPRTLSDEEIMPFVSGLIDSLHEHQISDRASIGAIRAAFPELRGVIPFAIRHGFVSPSEPTHHRNQRQMQVSDVVTMLYMRRVFRTRGGITEEQLEELGKVRASHQQIIEQQSAGQSPQ